MKKTGVKKKHGRLGKWVFAFCLLPALALTLCAFVKYIPASALYLPSLTGYVFFPLYLLNLLLAFVYLCARSWRCTVFAAVLILNYPNLKDVLQWKGNPETALWREHTEGEDTKVKILTYNVRLFDYYNELKRGGGSDGTAGVSGAAGDAVAGVSGGIKRQLLDFIGDADADVVCLQEYYESKWEKVKCDAVMRRAGYLYATAAAEGKKGMYGNRIFSKYPFAGSGIVEGLDAGSAVYADILINRDTLRVYNFHLASFLFDGEDEQFFGALASRQGGDMDYSGGSMRVLRKMKRSTLKRERQIKTVLEDALRVPGKVVLCGDMNEQPVSYSRAAVIKAGFCDAFLKGGEGFGLSYHGKFPSYRIDYIFSRNTGEPVFFNTYKVDYSDHRPVSAVYNI